MCNELTVVDSFYLIFCKSKAMQNKNSLKLGLDNLLLHSPLLHGRGDESLVVQVRFSSAQRFEESDADII